MDPRPKWGNEAMRRLKDEPDRAANTGGGLTLRAFDRNVHEETERVARTDGRIKPEPGQDRPTRFVLPNQGSCQHLEKVGRAATRTEDGARTAHHVPVIVALP